MAKSTYLQLCNTVARECSLTGNGLTTIVGQTAMYNRVVNWVAEADQAVQAIWFDWDFLHVGTWSANTVISNPLIAAPSNIGVWDVESFYLDYSTDNYQNLPVIDYKEWRKSYRLGTQTNARPERIVILPDQSLRLSSPPAAIYTLTADYWQRPAKMTADADTSPIPEEYERVIVAKAKMAYAEFDSAPEITYSASAEYQDLMDKLEAKYLSNQAGRRLSDPGMMVVVPE